MPISQAEIDKTFALLEAAAVKGERCPQAYPFGPISKANTVGILAREGRVLIEIYAHNYRRVTILVGPNKGKATAAPANPHLKPYKIISAAGTRSTSRGRWIDEGRPSASQPSKPRALTRKELGLE